MLETGGTGQHILHCDLCLMSSQHLQVLWPPSSAIGTIMAFPQPAFSVVTKQETIM